MAKFGGLGGGAPPCVSIIPQPAEATSRGERESRRLATEAVWGAMVPDLTPCIPVVETGSRGRRGALAAGAYVSRAELDLCDNALRCCAAQGVAPARRDDRD
jgi:hypothetical protein